MPPSWPSMFFIAILAWATAGFGATVEDARGLKNDALKLLQAGSNAETDTQACAEAVAKLQKAQQILESLDKLDSALAQEIGRASCRERV